jgi:alpha-tubulin suppressor-like RCC1 family protein
MPVTYPGVQYSGIWTMQQVNSAIAAGTWPQQPGPSLYSWGSNGSGQLGLGNTTSYSSPKQVGALRAWSKVAEGNGFTLSIKTDGSLWSWGQGYWGALGLGNVTYYSSPKQVGSLTSWSNIACGSSHALATKTDGTLWSWGKNTEGQLGLGDATNRSSPAQVGSLITWLAVACGPYFSLATKTDGTLWSWGNNNFGQLGIGNITRYSSPKQIGSLVNWSKISGFGNSGSTVAIKTDGTIWIWGANAQGQLGLGNTTNYSSPKQIGALTSWLNISGGGYGTVLATRTNNTLYGWGYNNVGQLGLGDTTNRSSPNQIGALVNWLSVSVGIRASLSIKTDGTLWAWGGGASGALGLGSTTNYSSPKQVGNLTSWLSVSAGYYSTVAIANT